MDKEQILDLIKTEPHAVTRGLISAFGKQTVVIDSKKYGRVELGIVTLREVNGKIEKLDIIL